MTYARHYLTLFGETLELLGMLGLFFTMPLYVCVYTESFSYFLVAVSWYCIRVPRTYSLIRQCAIDPVVEYLERHWMVVVDEKRIFWGTPCEAHSGGKC